MRLASPGPRETEQMSRIKSILVVGGPPARRASLVQALASEDWLCAEASDEEEAERVLRQVRPAVVLLLLGTGSDEGSAPSPDRLRRLPFLDGIPIATFDPSLHPSAASRSIDAVLAPDPGLRLLLGTLEELRQPHAA